MAGRSRTRKPTQRQREAWEALHRHQNVRSAADALGITPYGVREACEAYMRNAGIDGPMPFVRVYRSRLVGRELEDARREVEAARAERDSLREQLEEARTEIALLRLAAHPWVEVHARLERIERAVSRPTVVTHRRLADGGIGGRRERRAA